MPEVSPEQKEQQKKTYGPSGFQGYPNFTTIATCVPWSGRPLPPELVMAFKNCGPPMNCNMIQFESKSTNIAEARNQFARIAKDHGAKYMFFWDEDVLLPVHALREMCFVMDNWDNIGVIAGVVCLKTERPEPMVFKKRGDGPYWDWKVGEVFEVEGGFGLGCSLVRTAVFDDIEEPWFRTISDRSQFLDNIPYGEDWTEDLYFCRKVFETKKWRLVCHGQLLCPHVDIRTGKKYELPLDSKPMRALTFLNGQKKILDVGSGPDPLKTPEGRVVTVDIRDCGADYRCDFRRLPFAAGEFDVVHSSHSLEHVPRADTDETLDEWLRVLKPDGELRITVPNIEWAAKRIIEGNFDKVSMVDAHDVLYGQQKYFEDRHYNGFTPKLLESMLKKRGFKTINIDLQEFHIICRAWRKAAPNGKKNGHPGKQRRNHNSGR